MSDASTTHEQSSTAPAAFTSRQGHAVYDNQNSRASCYTRAKLFQPAGKRTDGAVRFSTVIGGRDSSESAVSPPAPPA